MAVWIVSAVIVAVAGLVVLWTAVYMALFLLGFAAYALLGALNALGEVFSPHNWAALELGDGRGRKAADGWGARAGARVREAIKAARRR